MDSLPFVLYQDDRYRVVAVEDDGELSVDCEFAATDALGADIWKRVADAGPGHIKIMREAFLGMARRRMEQDQ